MTPVAVTLLQWYDRHARDLPWRKLAPDPYRVWLSEIMLQQTTTAAVAPYYARFLARWPDVTALAAANDPDVMNAWAGLGYYARARNLLACARMIVNDHGGRFPETEAGLLALPGIGAYTAAAIAAIAFGCRAVVVDGNVERVVSRLFAIETPLPASKREIRIRTDELTPAQRAGDFAQAMMDLGATICTPTRPACILCPLSGECLARQMGIQETLPRKMPKANKPARVGVVFVATRADGAVLVRTRPGQGLLGGMTEFPGLWPVDRPVEPAWLSAAPFEAHWKDAGRAIHGFTHFDLELAVFRSENAQNICVDMPLRWVAPQQLADEAFPSLMRKVAAAAALEIAAVSAGDGLAPAPAPALRASRGPQGRPRRPTRRERG